METKQLAVGTVHNKVPNDVRQMLEANPKALDTWESATPLARNEWLCLLTSAKQAETQIRRLERARDQLSRGQRRPCCWAGCIHRQKTGRA